MLAKIRKRNNAKYDRVTGVDRYPASAHKGALVLPVIYLWKRPGVKPKAGNLSGALQHGSRVEVLKTQMVNGDRWCLVQANVKHDGETHLQKGWVKGVLLEKTGAPIFERMKIT